MGKTKMEGFLATGADGEYTNKGVYGGKSIDQLDRKDFHKFLLSLSKQDVKGGTEFAGGCTKMHAAASLSLGDLKDAEANNTNYDLVSKEDLRLVGGQASTFFAFTKRIPGKIGKTITLDDAQAIVWDKLMGDLGKQLSAYEFWTGKFEPAFEKYE